MLEWKLSRVRRCLSESGWVGRRLRESCSELEDVWVKAVELEDVWGKAVELEDVWVKAVELEEWKHDIN